MLESLLNINTSTAVNPPDSEPTQDRQRTVAVNCFLLIRYHQILKKNLT